MAVAAIAIAGSATAVAVTTGVTGAVVAGVTIGAIGAATIGAAAGYVVSSVLAKEFIEPPQHDFGSSSDFGAASAGTSATSRDILVSRRGNNVAIPIVYGKRRVGGTVVFLATYSDQLAMNLVIAEGKIAGVLEVYINGTLSTDSKFLGIYSGAFYSGTNYQLGDSTLSGWFSYYSTYEHRLRNTAYLSLKFKYDPEAYPGGAPRINALINGSKIYDPRNMTIAWSDNPALCVRDYLTNERYGKGLDTSLIDDVSFISSANYCDESVIIAGSSQKRYTCNGAVNTENTPMTIVNKMLTSCKGMLIFTGGKYKLIIDKPEIAVFTFSEDNIVGGWSIKMPTKNTLFNGVKANFFNKDKEYQADIAYVKSNALRTIDGGILERTIDLPFTTDIARAKMLATIFLNQSRQGIICSFTATIEGLRAETGDVVYIKHDTPGWSDLNGGQGKRFRIISISIKNNDEVDIVAKEYDSNSYDYGNIPLVDTAPNTTLVDITPTQEYTDNSVTLPKIAKGTPEHYITFDQNGDAIEVISLEDRVALLETKVTTNTSDISNIQGDITTNTSDISNIQGDITTNTSDISNIQGDISNIQGDITTNTSDIDQNTSAITDIQNDCCP